MKMDDEELYSRLSQVFDRVFGDETIKLTPELTADDVDGWDSVTHVRLMLSVEREFKIKIKTSEIGKLENVGDLAALIRARL
jgi:acyl carrier protein